MAQPQAHARIWSEVSGWLDTRSSHRSPRGHLGFDSVAIIVGPSGVGKSYGLSRLIAEKGWDPIIIDQERTASAKDFQEVITKALTTNLLQSLAGEERPRIIMMDNADALFQTERMYAIHLVALLERSAPPLPHIPVVITCTYDTERRLCGLRRCHQFQLRPLPAQDVFLFLRGQASGLPADRLMEIAEASNGSIRAAISMIGDTSGGPLPAPAAPCAIAPEQPMLYRADARDAHHIRSLIADRIWMAPLLFHENLPAELGKRKGTARAKLDYYRGFLWALATWDVWMAQGADEDCTEYPVELITQWILRMGVVFGQKTTAAPTAESGGGQEEFTRLFSTLSIQKKTARAAYGKISMLHSIG